jgi:putative tricarboxylic transport membrane protein
MTQNIVDGALLLADPLALSLLVIGVAIGFILGALPGFSGSNGAALVLPLAVGLPLETALSFIVAIYVGSNFGNAVPAILMNVPGGAAAAVTALDGWPMTEKGQGSLAMGVGRMASVIGGLATGLAALFLLQPMSQIALAFGPAEMFLVAVAGLCVAPLLMGDNLWKGLLSVMLGLLMAAMSMAPMSGQRRMTFGLYELFDGIPFVPALIGLFALSQVFLIIRRDHLLPEGARKSAGRAREGFSEIIRGIKLTLRSPGTLGQSSAIGGLLGVLPGAGSAIVPFISYGVAKTRSKEPESFGRGNPKGVIAAEASDSAVAGGMLIPTLTLGIPGSATAAILLATLYLQGVQPGPRVMVTHAPEAHAVVIAVILASIVLLPLGILVAKPMELMTRLRTVYLAPPIIAVSLIGMFAIRNMWFDVLLGLGFGVLGVFLRTNGYPIAPVILGLILGPLAESNFSRALMIGNQSVSYFWQSTVSKTILALLTAAIAFRIFRWLRSRRSAADRVTSERSLR